MRVRNSGRARGALQASLAAGPPASRGDAGYRRLAAARWRPDRSLSLPFPREPALKNHGCRGTVDVLTANASALPARALRLQCRARLDGGKAFIDPLDRQTEAALQLRGEGERSRRQRAGTVVHIIRGSHDEEPRVKRLHFSTDGVPVGAVSADIDGGTGSRGAGEGVACGDANAS